MAAEAEATDILLRLTMEGAEYFLRFTGETAGKAVALFFAGLKAVYEKNAGKQKLGGKVSARAFLESFATSSIFPLKKSELEKLVPELKRLHIPYMQYKQSKEMRADGSVEISVRADDALRFQRLCEAQGIITVPLDFEAEELSPNTYEELLKESGDQKQVDISASEDGITIDEKENPTPAQAGPGRLSAQPSQASDTVNFDPNTGVRKNLDTARMVMLQKQVEAARLDGRLIPLSINKDTLLIGSGADQVQVYIPGTKRQECLTIPRGDIVSMEADAGQTIRADLRATALYAITDPSGRVLRKETGTEIHQRGHWNTRTRQPLKQSRRQAR